MEPAICKCSNKGRNLVICIDGTSNQFGEQNTNVVELYSKIVKTEDSGQLTYYNSGIGTYAKPSWKSAKYLMQVIDNTVDLAIAWNFEKIVIGAYRWLSDNYQENDRIFLFGFSRGAYQVRTLAGMIQRVGLIHKGNEEQIPFAYELYATHTTALATRFKTTFSRENVQVHFVGVWDTVSSVGIIRGKSLPLTDSADHVCFFRHALALDERRVKFLPEYIHGGICEKSTAPVHPKAQIEETGFNRSPHIKEVWFPGTHSDIGGGNQLNPDLDLGRTPFLWMSFEAVSCGLRLRPTRVEWRWDHLSDMKESLTGVWHIFEWIPFRRLSYKDESSTVSRLHKGRGRKIKSGQKVHSSIAFCDESYHPRAMLPKMRRLDGLVGKGSLSNREWVKGWEDLIEMDIFDLSLMSNVIEMLKSGTGSETSIWVYRLRAMASTDEGLTALRDRLNIINDFVQIFTRANQPIEVQECVMTILEKSSKDRTSTLLTSEHRLWLLRVAREGGKIHYRSFAVKLLAHYLPNEQSFEDIIDENALGILDEMARDEQRGWLTDGAFAMFTTILNQNTLSQKLFAANTLGIVRTRFTAEDLSSQDVAKRLFGVILQSGQNRRHIFDNDVLHSFLTNIDELNDTERLLFQLFLVNQHEYLPSEYFTVLTSKLFNKLNVSDSRCNILLVLRDTIDSDGLRKRIWNSDIARALLKAFNQVGFPVRSVVLELYRKCIMYESLRDDLFDANTVRDIENALFDTKAKVTRNAIDFFIEAMAQEGFRDKIFDTEIITAFQHALVDRNELTVRSSMVEILTAAIAQEGFRDKIFDIKIITALQHALSDGSEYLKSGVVDIFTCAIAQEGLRDKIVDTEIITTIGGALNDIRYYVGGSVVKFFTCAITQEGIRNKIFETEIIATLQHALSDKNQCARKNLIEIITAVTAQEGVCSKIIDIFDTKTITALQHALDDQDEYVRRGAVEIFTCAIAQEGLLDKIFDPKIITLLGCALNDVSDDMRRDVVEFFTCAISHGGLRDKIFDTKIITALQHAISDQNKDVRRSAVAMFTCATVHKGIRDKMFNTKIITALGRALNDRNYDIKSVVKFFTFAIAQEGLHDKIFDTEIITALGRALNNDGIGPCVVEFFTCAISQENFRDKTLYAEIITTLKHALSDPNQYYARRSAVKIFTVAIAQEGPHDKIFDTEIITALGRALNDRNYDIESVVKFFTCAIAQEGLHDKIFDTEIITALRRALNNDGIGCVVKFFACAISQESFRDKIFNTEIITALGRALNDKRYDTRSVVHFFTCAIAQEGFRDKIFDTEIITALGCALSDKRYDDIGCVVKFFTRALNQEGIRNKIFDTKNITALERALSHENHLVRCTVVGFFTNTIAQEGIRNKILDTKIITALGCALSDQDEFVRGKAVEFFTCAIAQEGIRNKIFDTTIITALGHVLNDKSYVVRKSVVEFFICAISQEGFQHKIFDIVTVPSLLQGELTVNFWSHASILSRAYNHFITSTLCEQLTSADLSLRDQTRYLISEAIKYDDVHTRICTVELRKHFYCPHHVLSA